MINLRCLVLSCLASLALSLPGAASSVSVSGSTTVASAIMQPHKAEIEERSGLTLDVVANGSSRGVADLVEGRSTIAMISAPLDVTIEKIAKKSPGLLKDADLVGHEIGRTVVAFVVHPSNPVKSVTLDQVTGILTGEVTNWSELGGPNMPIVVVAETSGGGVRSLVESELLDGASVSAELREFPNATQVPAVSLQLPNTFGIAGFDAASAAGAAVLNTDETISQPLILVTLGDPDDETKRVIEASRAAGS